MGASAASGSIAHRVMTKPVCLCLGGGEYGTPGSADASVTLRIRGPELRVMQRGRATPREVEQILAFEFLALRWHDDGASAVGPRIVRK